MKKIGIVCDNYKLEKYKETLKEKGFNEFEEIPDINGFISKEITVIKVIVPDWNYRVAKKQIEKICHSLEFSFRSRN